MVENPMKQMALKMVANGMSPIPIKSDGTKTPPFSWKQYQTTPPTKQQVEQWWTTNPNYGIGVITGAVSGNLTMLEFEGRAQALIPKLRDLAHDSGLGNLWDKLLQGWSETTPSGGIHFYYRTTTAPQKNTRLATRPRQNSNGIDVLIETRGEGGLSVTAPTPGTHHATGKPWGTLLGGPDTCPTLTGEEQETLFDLLRTADETPHPTPTKQPTPTASSTEGLTPGDDYENKTSWEEILTPHGWTLSHTQGTICYWRRPGKQIGVSATTGKADDRDRLYVFTTSTEFDTETPYTKFGAYALLNHAGDYHAAAKTLASKGYGDKQDPIVFDLPVATTSTQATPDNVIPLFPTSTPQTDGATALKPNPPKTVTTTLDEVSETWNANLLIEVAGELLRHNADRDRWLVWNGYKWETCARGGGKAREHAKHVLQALPETLKGWRKTSLKASGISNTLTQAATDPRISITQDTLDTDPNILNTPGGPINLKTGTLQAPNPDLLCTKATYCTPDFDTPTPLWDKFLETTFAGHRQEVIDYVQTLTGYSATGHVGHHVFPFLYGAGANGKSVFADVMVKLLGDYATVAPNNFLMVKQNQHPTELARLQGMRLVFASEVNESSTFDEAKVKMLTGGDTITARYMHGDFFDFQPTHHLWLMGNYKPRVQAGGDSFWRRLREIPFTNSIPEKDRDDELTSKLIEQEGPGILAWIILGARRYLNEGITTPEEVRAATEEYQAEEDHIARFIDERVIVGGGGMVKTPVAEMRKAYTDWCYLEGIEPVSAKAFVRDVRARYQIESARTNTMRFYTNCTLTDTEGASTDRDPWNDLGGSN